jgi:hypothetical protein
MLIIPVENRRKCQHFMFPAKLPPYSILHENVWTCPKINFPYSTLSINLFSMVTSGDILVVFLLGKRKVTFMVLETL